MATQDSHQNSSESFFLLGNQVGIAVATSLSAADLIARFVTIEWQLRNNAADLPTTAPTGPSLQQSLARGAVRPHPKLPPPHESLSAQLQAAQDAHLDGQLVLVVDGRQYPRPDELIHLTPASKIALLRLALFTRS